MKNSVGIIIGFCVVILGIILLGNYLYIWDFNVFFDGWWTLFIIVPSLTALLTKREKVVYLIIFLIGILLLLDADNLLGNINIFNIIFAMIIINVGLNIAFRDKKVNRNGKKICAVFSGTEEKISKENPINDLVTVFGGIELDLRDAIIEDGTTIEAVCIFGGIDIFVPDDVKVKVNGVNMFGGVENKSNGNKKTLNINSTCIFGGIDIK